MRNSYRFLIYGVSKSFLIKIILALLILLIGKNVFALDYNVTNIITSPGNGQSGYYRGGDPSEGTDNYHVNTRYYGRLQHIEFNIPKPDAIEGDCYWTNMTYKVTMNMATNDWRNNFGNVSVRAYNVNYATSRVNFVSKQKIYFTFKIPSSQTTCIDYVYIDLPSSEYGLRITGETNWNLSSIILSDSLSSSSGGSSSTPSPTPDSSQNIINNQNQNTQSVIENNTQNTSDIINNANQNTQDIINNQNQNTEKTNSLLGSCYKNLFNFNVYDNSSNVLSLNNSINGFSIPGSSYTAPSGFTLSQFCPECKAGKTYYLKAESTSSNAKYIYLYGSNLSWSYGTSMLITQEMLNSEVLFYGVYPDGSGSGTVYISDIAIYEGTSNHPYGSFNEQICSSKLDDLQQQQNQNTQDIINNQNQNTQQQINSEKVCQYIDKSNIVLDNTSMRSSGNTYSQLNFGVTDYFNIIGSTIKVLNTYTISSSTDANLCFYNSNKEVLSCLSNNDLTNNQIINIPSNSNYVRFVIRKADNRPTFEICKNGNQAIQDSITDSNVESETGTDFFNNFNSSDNGGISGIITKPLVLINSLLSSNDSCSDLTFSIQFPGLESKTVSFPSGCILWNNVPSTVVNIYQMFVVAFCSYYLLRRLFKDVENLKNPEKDEVEVIDL